MALPDPEMRRCKKGAFAWTKSHTDSDLAVLSRRKAANRIHFRFRTAHESDSDLCVHTAVKTSDLCHILAKNLIRVTSAL